MYMLLAHVVGEELCPCPLTRWVWLVSSYLVSSYLVRVTEAVGSMQTVRALMPLRKHAKRQAAAHDPYARIGQLP